MDIEEKPWFGWSSFFLRSEANFFFSRFSTDPAEILSVTSSAAKSWIGQTVTLKCVSDGVPAPTLTWYKPDGNELNIVTAKESTVQVFLKDEKDFGEYKWVAYNGLDPSNDVSWTLAQIRTCRLNKVIVQLFKEPLSLILLTSLLKCCRKL